MRTFDSKVISSQLYITFDDGGKSNLLASHLLDEYGYKGHFFISTKFIGTKGFLSKDEIQDIRSRGHIIGSHSHTHPDIFSKSSSEKIQDEWKRSIEILEDIIQEKIITASIPGGSIDNASLEETSKCGIPYLFTSEPVNRAWRVNNMLCFGRVAPKRGRALSDINKFILGRGYVKENLIWNIKKVFKKVIYFNR